MAADPQQRTRGSKGRRGGKWARMRREGLIPLQVARAPGEALDMEPCFVSLESLANDQSGHKPPVALGLHIGGRSHGSQVQRRKENASPNASAYRSAAAMPSNSKSEQSDASLAVDTTAGDVAHVSNAKASMRIPISYADSLRCVGRAHLEKLPAWGICTDEASSCVPDKDSFALQSKPDERGYRSPTAASADASNLTDALQEDFQRVDDRLEVTLQALYGIQAQTNGIAAAISHLQDKLSGHSVVPVDDHALQLRVEAKFRQCLSSLEEILQSVKCSSETFVTKRPED